MKTKLLTALILMGLIPTSVSAERLSLSSLQNQITQLTQMLGDTNAQLAQAREELDVAQSELAELKNNTVLTLDNHVTLTRDANGLATVLFKGANLQVINGTDVTESANGLGNLIMGYNASKAVFIDRMGSHNIVLGDDQAYPNSGELVTEILISSKDLAITAGNNMSTLVGANAALTVGSNMSTTVGSSQTTDVGADSNTTIGANKSLTVGASKTVNVGTSKTVNIGINETITIGAAMSVLVGSDKTESIGGSKTVQVGDDVSMTFNKNASLVVDKNLTVDAGDQIAITTGAASAAMQKDGNIAILGKDISIQGSGQITIKASKDLVLKGEKILQN